MQRTQASWEAAVQEGKQMESLKLVSGQCRKQRLHSGLGRGPDPSFTPMVFLTLRAGPLTGAVQDASQLQKDASKLGGGTAGRQANGRFEASF